MVGLQGSPIDVNFFRRIIHQESWRLNLHSAVLIEEKSFTMTLALAAAVKKVFYEKSQTTFSNEPVIEKKLITQFMHRMRVDAMEKFNATTVFAVIKFAVNEEGLEHQEYLITLIVYLEQEFVPEFLRLLRYPYIDGDDETEVKDACGTLCNLIAGQYKKEMIELGYKDPMMSHFESYINTAPDGIEIPRGVTHKYEVSFEVENVKRLVLEMVILGQLPKN